MKMEDNEDSKACSSYKKIIVPSALLRTGFFLLQELDVSALISDNTGQENKKPKLYMRFNQ